MLVGDDDQVRRGHGAEVDAAVAQTCYRVNDDFITVKIDAHRAVHERVECHGLPARRDKTVGLGRVGGSRLVVLLPIHDATAEVGHLISHRGKALCGVGTASPAAAVHRHGALLAEPRGSHLVKITLLDVDVEGSSQMAVGKLFGRAHIEQLHIVICDEAFKLIGIHTDEGLLTAGRLHPQQGEQHCYKFLHYS